MVSDVEVKGCWFNDFYNILFFWKFYVEYLNNKGIRSSLQKVGVVALERNPVRKNTLGECHLIAI